MNLGEFLYFGHAQRFLEERARAEGVEIAVHPVRTLPTASIRNRAVKLLDAIEGTAEPDDTLHLVGHSTGGLDARLLLTPGVALGREVEPIAARVRTVVSVATPHRGTPSAQAFATAQGRRLLAVLSLATIYTLRFGSLPLGAYLLLARVVARLDNRVGGGGDVVDELFARLLNDFTPERRAAIRHFFGEVGADQTLVNQLGPDAMDLFDAATPDRPGVRYGCVVTRARRPSVRAALRHGLSPYGQGANALYHACWRLAGRSNPARLSVPTVAQREALAHAWNELPMPRDNDGMVPTLSQLHGEIVRAADADHLDVIGHFLDPHHDPPHYDWIPTGTGFRREHFEAVWTDVLHFCS